MSKESDALYGALFALEDVREILRQTAPGHKLGAAEKKRLAAALKEARESLKILEELK